MFVKLVILVFNFQVNPMIETCAYRWDTTIRSPWSLQVLKLVLVTNVYVAMPGEVKDPINKLINKPLMQGYLESLSIQSAELTDRCHAQDSKIQCLTQSQRLTLSLWHTITVNSIVTYGTFERVFPTSEQHGEEMSSNGLLCPIRN